MLSRTVVVADPQGIHALLAHELSQAAAEYSSSAWILVEGKRSSLARPLELLALGIKSGTQIRVVTDGIDEAAALETICSLLEAIP